MTRSHVQNENSDEASPAGVSRRESQSRVARLWRSLGPAGLDGVDDARRGGCALVAVVAAVLGFLSTVPGEPSWLSGAFLAMFVLLGPGAALVSVFTAFPRPLTLAAVPVTGIALASLAATVELATGLFRPLPTTLGLATATLLMGMVVLWRTGPFSDVMGRIGRVRGSAGSQSWRTLMGARPALGLVSAALAVVAVAVASVGMARLPGTDPSEFGPLIRVPELLVAAVLVVVAFVVSARAASVTAAWISVFAAVTVWRGPTLFSTEEALYEWSYRHLGVMDWFNEVGHYVRGVDVYNNWPAALAFGSWFIGSSGVDPLAVNHGFQFGYHLLLVVAVYGLARCAGIGRMGAMGGTFVVEIAGWVAQDYLSPQAFAYLLATVVVAGLLVTPERRYRVPGIVVAVIAFTAIAWAHQLTPVWLLVAVGALVVTRAVRPWWVLLLLLAIYLPTVLVNLDSIAQNSAGFSFNPVDNSAGNVKTVGSSGQRFTSSLDKAMTGAVWLGALVTGAVWLRLGRRPGPLLVAGFSAFVMLGMSYGGETIFRVFLLSVLGCGILVGAALVDAIGPSGRVRRHPNRHSRSKASRGVVLGAMSTGLAVVVTMGIAFGGLQGFLGGFYALRFTSEDVRIARKVEAAAGERGLVVPLEWAYPMRSTWLYLPQARNDALPEAKWNLHDEYIGTDGSDPGPVHRFTEKARDRSADRPVYVVVTDSMRDFTVYFGQLTPEAPGRIVDHLRDDGWSTVWDADGATILANPPGVDAWR